MNPALFLLLCLVCPCLAMIVLGMLVVWLGAWRTPPYKDKRP